LPSKIHLGFLDDILVYSTTWDKQVMQAEQTLKILRQHKYFAKISKCVFGQ
jgi:hypothetical protein